MGDIIEIYLRVQTSLMLRLEFNIVGIYRSSLMIQFVVSKKVCMKKISHGKLL